MNGVLVVDKGPGCTSHDVVAIARRVLCTRAIGHAGTLDPMATGVLVLAVGEGTKLVSYLTSADKAYDADVALGVETISGDAEGEVTARADVPTGLTRAAVEAAAAQFIGDIDQVAPAVSAIKVDGERLHARVRRGEAVVAPTRQVRCDSIEVLEVTPNSLRLRVRCGKGFYVRSLARDLARALGTVGHLTALRRTQSGPFTLDGSVTFDDLLAAKTNEALRAPIAAAVIPMARAWGADARLVLNEEGARDAFHGRAVAVTAVTEGAPADGDERVFACFDGQGHLLALARREGDSLHVLRGFRAHLHGAPDAPA